MMDQIFDHEKLDVYRLSSDPMKARLKCIVAMLTRLAMRSDRVSESSAWHEETGIDYEYEHEHEHEHE